MGVESARPERGRVIEVSRERYTTEAFEIDFRIWVHVSWKTEESPKCSWDSVITPSTAASKMMAADTRDVTLNMSPQEKEVR